MKTELIWFIMMLIIVIYILFCSCETENMTSLEAVENIASLYNSNNMTVGNLNVTGNGTINGDATIKGKLYADGDIIMHGTNSWLIRTPPDEKKMHIVPMKGTDWDFSKQITIDENGVITGPTIRSDLVTTSQLKADGRLHIAGGELLYLLNTNGVMVGKEWGGNGNITVQGNASIWQNMEVRGKFIKRFDNIQAGDGGDIKALDNIANDNDCKNTCMNEQGSYTALYNKPTKRCWCKNHMNMKGGNNDYVTWWIN